MPLFPRCLGDRKAFLWLVVLLVNAPPLQAQVRLISPAAGSMPLPYGRPALAKGTIYLPTESGIEARSVDDAHLLWTHPLVHNVPAALFVKDDRLIVAEAAVYALDTKTGAELWHFQPKGDTSLCIGTIADDLFIIGDTNHWIYALRISTGSLAWQKQTTPKQKAKSRVAGVAPFGRAVYVTEENWSDEKGLASTSILMKLSATTGSVMWQISSDATKRPKLSQSSWLQPVAMPNGDVLVADSSQNIVTRFTVRGEQLWSFAGVPGYFGPLVPPEVRDNIVFFESGDRYFRQLRASDGTQVRQTLFAGSLTDFTLCGDSAIVSRGALEKVNLASGDRAKQSLISSAHIISARLVHGEDHKSVIASNGEGLWIVACDTSE